MSGHSGTRTAWSVLTGDGHEAVPVRPWTARRANRRADGRAARCYVAFPSAGQAIVIASRDRAVLRHAAGSLLTPPPGTGRLMSVVLTAGLRLLRWRAAWDAAAACRAAGLVTVRRRR
ncbi:MAG: hypothetical protein M0030_17670 [Actinomycetota bacterium]|nr:hypothetical protein [Actinomycetota bacterium]